MARLVGTVVVGLGFASAAHAHHGFGNFAMNEDIELTGEITKLAFVNPHSWVYFNVTEPDGKVTNWGIEFGSPNALLRRGLRKSDFPPGITVTVKGYLAKSGKPVVNASTVTLPDGRSLFAGSSTTPGGQP